MRSVSRPTPALVVAIIALVCSMAGTGYAAAQLSGKSIKKRTIPANRIVPDVLGGTQINEGLLGQVPSALNAELAKKADTATTAESALAAETAKKADQATDALALEGKSAAAFMPSKTTARIYFVANVAANNGAEGTAECLPGEKAISGGGAWYQAGTDTTIGSGTLSTSAPVFDNQGRISGWRAEGKNTSTVARDFRAWVVCVG